MQTSATHSPEPIIMDSDMKLLKVISLLIDYPTNELFADDTLNECRALVNQSTLISPEVRKQISDLIDDLLTIGVLDAQARYDGLFERGRSLSLWLFEHVHGESRDRGQAMVDLMEQYSQAGFEIGIKELPDYLPLYLEFLAYQAAVIKDDIKIRMDIADISHIIALLAARLQDRNSIYLGCFHALLQIAGKPLSIINDYQEKVSQEVRDDTKLALDKDWEETAVDFMAAEQQERCPSQTRAMDIAATQAENARKQVDVPIHWVDFQNKTSNNNISHHTNSQGECS